MERIHKIWSHSLYQEQFQKLQRAEAGREFCRHTLAHFLDVARIAYIGALEEGVLTSNNENRTPQCIASTENACLPELQPARVKNACLPELQPARTDTQRSAALTKELIYAAALLHDIGRYAQLSEGTPHEKAGAKLAGQIMAECGFAPEETETVQAAIQAHRGKAPAAQTEIQAHRGELSAAQAAVQAHCDELSAAQAAIHAHRGELSAAQAAIQAHRGKAQAAIQAHRGELSAAQAAIHAHHGELSAAQAAIPAHHGELSAAQTGLNASGHSIPDCSPAAGAGCSDTAALLSRLLYRADKQSRCCFACPAAAACNWSAEKRNLRISI